VTDSRRKGRDAQTAFRLMLEDRDWSVLPTVAGQKCCDLIAAPPTPAIAGWVSNEGDYIAWEVKDTKLIGRPAFLAQAKRQAKEHKMPWGLACHLWGTTSWIVERQGEKPTIWHERSGK